MRLHRLSRTIYIGTELRIGRLVLNPLPYTGHVHCIWFRKRSTNLVWSFPYRKPKSYRYRHHHRRPAWTPAEPPYISHTASHS